MTNILGATPIELDKWSNTAKGVLLILAIVIFLPIFYVLYYSIGAIGSAIVYSVYLIIIAILIYIWANKRYGKEKS